MKKGVTKDTKDALLNDLAELSLEKYLSELITTTSELLWNISTKNENIIAVTEVISAIHQRFNVKFTGKLFELFLVNFVNPPVTDKNISALVEKEELTRLTKLKARVTLLTELYLVGVFTSLDIVEDKDSLPLYLQKKVLKKEPFIFTILKELLNYKFKFGFTTLLVTHFVLRFPTFFDNNDHSWDPLIHDEQVKPLLQSLFKAFADAVLNKTVDLDKKIHKLFKEHQKCQIRTGRLVDEYLEEHDTLVPIFQRFESATTVFVEIFKLDPPKLVKDDKVTDEEPPQSMITNQVLPASERLWENEEIKRFYENLPDIEEMVKESQSRNSSSDTELMNKFFVDLELADTKDSIDKLINEYWKLNLDNKATRNRLLKFFIESQDWSKIKVYARFLAANHKYFPDIVEDFIKYLDNGFRNQLHSSKINVKNIIFFAEMVKFMLVPSYIIFHKIRTLIMNLQIQNNVEILTIFFEHAGKFLIHKPEFKAEMEKMIQLLKTKARDRQLGMNVKSAIENSLTLLYPPSVSTLNQEKRELTNEEKFYHVVIRSELARFNAKGATILLRKATWSDPAVYKTMFELFTEVDKMNYQNVPLLAQILSGLYPYYKNFVIKVIDQTIENIERGLEINDYGENMTRVVQVRYLTEIFNMQMIKSDVLLEIIFFIMKFGYPNNQPVPNVYNPLDPPDNYFRVQLITIILLNVERYPSVFKKTLELILRFFEYYTYIKKQPLPIETQFKVKDTFTKYEKLIKFQRAENLLDSATRLQSLLQSMNRQDRSGNADDIDKEIDPSFMDSKDKGKKGVNEIKEEEEEEDDEDDEPRYTDDEEEESHVFKTDDTNVDNDIIISEEKEMSDASGVSDFDDLDIESSGCDTSSVDSSSEDDEEDDDDDDDDDDDENNDEEEEDDDDDEFKDIDVDRNIELERMYNEFKEKLQTSEERKIEGELEKQLQQMMNESIEERKSEKITSSSLPILSMSNGPKLLGDKKIRDNGSKIAFTFLTKSGKKTNTRTVGLPKDIKFVSNVLEEEEKLRSEREKIKKIVLQRSFD